MLAAWPGLSSVEQTKESVKGETHSVEGEGQLQLEQGLEANTSQLDLHRERLLYSKGVGGIE